ncbi:MAG: hypothetical protein M5U28_00530 [Sandaracinaceae bacterium]|nr:hypothetical protein [Sandaracinaceae bacterium]
MKRAAPLLAIALVAVVARADGGPTLHEFVPDLGSEEGSLLVSSGGAQPDAIVYQGEILPAPEGGALRADERPMRAQPGDGHRNEEAGRRSPTFRPDRVTELNDTVPYYTVFTPTIAPFKRVTSYDTVSLAPDGTPVLGIAPGPRERLEPLGAEAEPPPGRPFDRFWGSVVLDLSEGTTVPFPRWRRRRASSRFARSRPCCSTSSATARTTSTRASPAPLPARRCAWSS